MCARTRLTTTLLRPITARLISTSTLHPANPSLRQLALPIAFLSVQGWDQQGLSQWDEWAQLFASKGFSSLMLSIDPTPYASSSSQHLLASLETDLTSLIKESNNPFPPLLISSNLSTLLSQTYVSSHPLSGLILYSPTPALVAHSLHPTLFKTALEEFTYEPNFAVGVMSEEGIEEGRLMDICREEEGDGWVSGLKGGLGREGAEVVCEFMDDNGL